MLFSQRYFRAIERNVFFVDIPDAARRKLCRQAFHDSYMTVHTREFLS